MNCIVMKYSILFLSGFLCSISVFAQPEVDFVPVNVGGLFSSPVDIANARDNSGRLFIVEKEGRIRIVQNNAILPGYFLDISSSVITTSECGLLGLDFHPNYPATPYIYVFYMRSGPVSRIARFTLNPSDPNDIEENTEFTILDIGGHPTNQYNHKAGDLAFGPDGYLYISVGDGGGGDDPDDNGQDSLSLLGKLLRLDVDGGTPYAIPPGNPGIGSATYLDEIWVMGLRNPWRFSFDGGDLWIADVGQGAREEVNFIASGTSGGVNCGWDCFEGSLDHSTSVDCQEDEEAYYRFPIFSYPRNCNQACPYGTGTCVIGGFVYRGSDFPSMNGYYICADRGSNNYWAISHDGSNTTVHLFDGDDQFSSLNTFGLDEDGELYAAANGGQLYRVVGGEILPVYLTHFEAFPQPSSVLLRWRAENTAEITSFIVERGTRAAHFEPIGTVTPEAGKSSYSFTDQLPESKLNYYRLVYTLADGNAIISEMRTVDLRQTERASEVYTHPGGGLAVRLFSETQQAEVLLFTANGKLLSTHLISAGYSEIPGTSALFPGIYMVVIKGAEDTAVHKWLKGEY